MILSIETVASLAPIFGPCPWLAPSDLERNTLSFRPSHSLASGKRCVNSGLMQATSCLRLAPWQAVQRPKSGTPSHGDSLANRRYHSISPAAAQLLEPWGRNSSSDAAGLDPGLQVRPAHRPRHFVARLAWSNSGWQVGLSLFRRKLSNLKAADDTTLFMKFRGTRWASPNCDVQGPGL